MPAERRVAFLTGTRADFGKLKPLVLAARDAGFSVSVFVTGMHMLRRYGLTVREVENLPDEIEIFRYMNQSRPEPMEIVVANTIGGLSHFLEEYPTDLLVVHGDRAETLAGAITGAMRGVLVAHVEGGELSGTIDGVVRHAVSKLAHVHLVANDEAAGRLLQLGEAREAIKVIGSPDIDVMMDPGLPDINDVLTHYEIDFGDYCIALYHPASSDLESTRRAANEFVTALMVSRLDFVVVHPNNDPGADQILQELSRLDGNPRFRLFPSIRFEYFLSLLRNAKAIVGNSSAGIREAPIFGIPSVNIGDRQRGRHASPLIIDVPAAASEILRGIEEATSAVHRPVEQHFGTGGSARAFRSLLESGEIFAAPHDKTFLDLEWVSSP